MGRDLERDLSRLPPAVMVLAAVFPPDPPAVGGIGVLLLVPLPPDEVV